ncbi:hypothetical protein vBValMR10Z_257 [Vibrio phage vB_ValM_R10Z]|nr:hypothetical protein vBValMR10Z_257 [Vibrio phage vB_ValM_R10Z]
MSLIAWYPLHKDLKDWSGNENHLSLYNDSGAIVDSQGKLGMCQERTVYNTTDHLRSERKVNLNKDFTLAAWIRPMGNYHLSTANGIVTLHSHSDDTGPGLTLKCDSVTSALLSCNTGNGTSRTYHTYYGTTNMHLKWHHCVMRYADGVVTLWVDGVVERTFSYDMAYQEDYIALFAWSTTYLGASNYRPTCKLNDVRVYDHALSTAEIKELARGLQVHYTFDDLEPGFENRIVNSSLLGAVPFDPLVHTNIGWNPDLHEDALIVPGWSSGWNGGSDPDNNRIHAHFKEFQGETVGYANNIDGGWLGLTHTTLNNELLDPGLETDPNGSPNDRRIGRKMILSLDVYTEDVGSGIPYWDIGLYRPVIGGNRSFAKRMYVRPTRSKAWERIQVEFEIDAQWDWESNSSATIYFYGHYGPTGPKYFKNVQLELMTDRANDYKVSNTTGRFINPAQYDLHDASGLNHDAEYIIHPDVEARDYTSVSYSHMSINNTKQPVVYNVFDERDIKPSPVGHTVYWAPGSDAIWYSSNGYDMTQGEPGAWVVDGYVPPEDSFTWMAWINKRNQRARDSVLVSCGGGWDTSSGFEIGYGWGDSNYAGIAGERVASGGAAGFPGSVNEWSHCALVFDGETGITKWYVNGVVTKTHSGSPRDIGFGFGYLKVLNTGAFRNSISDGFYGGVADYKIYAKALEQSEIQELMNIKTSIDNKGQLNSSRLVEGWDDSAETEIQIRSSSESFDDGTATFIDGVKQGAMLSRRGLNFCIFDHGMNLRGFGNLDTYAGTVVSQYYEFDGEVYVSTGDDVTDAQDAHNWVKHAIDKMEDGWLLSIARCDASSAQDGTLDEYFKTYFSADYAPSEIITRGTWSLIAFKNGQKLLEEKEGRRYNEQGVRINYTRTSFLRGSFNTPNVNKDGTTYAGVFDEVGNTDSLYAYLDFTDVEPFEDKSLSRTSITQFNNPMIDKGGLYTDGTLAANGGVFIDNSLDVTFSDVNWDTSEFTMTVLCTSLSNTQDAEALIMASRGFHTGIVANNGRYDARISVSETSGDRWYTLAGSPHTMNEMTVISLVKKAKEFRLYVNGSLLDTATLDDDFIEFKSDHDISFGYSSSTSEDFRFNGVTHKGKLHTKALSNIEIEREHKLFLESASFNKNGAVSVVELSES